MNILFPIETITRELDSRLMLAVRLASRSRRILLGQHSIFDDLIRNTPLRGGVYFGKQLIRRTAEQTQAKYLPFKERDFSVVFLHEEGGIFAGDEGHWRKQLNAQIDPSVLFADDHLCAWGEFQAEHYRQRQPDAGDRITATGHPRFDLLKPAYRKYYEDLVVKIRRDYGKYILLNTNFTVANNICGLQDTFSPRLGYRSEVSASRIEVSQTWAHRLRTLSHFIVLAQKLSADFPDYHIVVRPHPSENVDFYRTCLSGIENLTVTQAGAVGPWLLGADLLIHDGCTTAIEAYFAETPTINFKPESDTRYDLRIPNEFGRQCATIDEIVEQVKNLSAGERRSIADDPKPSATALRILANFSAESTQPLIDIVSTSPSRNSVTPSERQLRTRERKWRKWLKRKVREELNKTVRPHTSDKQKFPCFQPHAVHSSVQRLNDMFHCQARIKFYGENLLEIYVD